MPLIEDLLSRENDLLKERMLLDSLIGTINRYVTPYDFDPQTRTMPGDERGQWILDGTAQDGLATASNTIISAIVPTDSRNFSLVPDDESLRLDDDVNTWYDQVSTIIFRYISTSNIRTAAHPVVRDIYAKGTGCAFMALSNDQGKLLFRPYAMGSYVIAENDEGIVDTIFRRSCMSLRNVKTLADKLGPRASLSRNSQHQLENNRLDDPVEILHCVYPRDTQLREVRGTTPPTEYPYASVWIERDNNHVISEGGFFTCPYLVPRWNLYPGFPYGFSPLMNVLADVKTLNKLTECALKSVDLAVNPALIVSNREDLVKEGQRFRIYPGRILPMRDMQGLRPFEPGQKVDVAQIELMNLQNQIRRGLGVDRMQIEPPSGDTQRSATEIAHRIATNNRQMGPGLSRLEDEFLEPTVLNTFVLLSQAGKLPAPPDAVIEAARGNMLGVGVRFEGSLSRQARQIDLQAITNFYTILQMIAQFKPEVLDLPDHDQMVREAAMAVGLGDSFMFPQPVVDQIRADRAEQQRQQALQQAMVQGAEIMNNIPERGQAQAPQRAA